MTKKACLIVLLFLGGCVTQPKTAVVKKTTERPEVARDPDTGLPVWMKAPEWWQKPMAREADEERSNRAAITVESRFYSIFEYQKFRDSSSTLRSVLSGDGYSIISGETADRLRKSMTNLDNASALIPPRLVLVNGQDSWVAVSEHSESTGQACGVGLLVKSDLKADGRVQLHFSAQNNAGSEDHHFEVSGEVALAPGQSYMKVVELHEADMAVVFVMSVPMIRYPATEAIEKGRNRVSQM